MTNLTSDQLVELHELIINRYGEFNCLALDPPTLGDLRLTIDVYNEWVKSKDPAMVLQRLSDITMAAKVAEQIRKQGYEMGRAEAKADPSIWHLKADPDGRLREVPPWEGNGTNCTARHAVPITDESEGGPPPLNHTAPDVTRPASESPTRQLSRAAATTLGPEHTVVTPLKVGANPRTLAEVDADAAARAERGRYKQPTTTHGTVLLDVAALVKELQRQAMGGVMPSQSVFNGARPANWATATAHLVRLGINWEDLAKEAGLRPRGRR